MKALAFSLLHFLWQGAAIAAVAGALMAACRSPNARYVVGMGALAAMLLSFGMTFALLSGSTPIELPSVDAALPVTGAPVFQVGEAALPVINPATHAEADFAWVARGWLAGVFLLALRVACGLLLLEHLRRRNLIALPDDLVARCRAVQAKVGITRLVDYCECRLVAVPSVIGFVRPVVLLPVRALTGLTTEQLESVIAHELGHVKRFDVAVNFFQVIAETLFFFHPAVWWLNRRIRADREDCCDDVAVAACGGKVDYARALVTMADWRDAPHLAMAVTGGPVAARVARLLGTQPRNGSAGVFTASIVLMAALLAGAVSLGISTAANAQAAAPVTVPTAAPAVRPVAAAQPAAAPASPPARPVRPAKPARPVAPPKPPRQGQDLTASMPRDPAAGSYIDEMKAVGFDKLDVDELISLRIQGVDGNYIRAIRDAGYAPDPGQVIAMKIHGVTPEYVAQMRAAGFEPGADQIIAMRAQGITPEYVQSMRASGLDAGAEEMVAMKIQNVTPEYRRSLEAAGYKLSVDELITAKIMDVTPEFIAQARSHGFDKLDIHQLIHLKNANVF